MLAIDLCSGTGSATAPMIERGWDVVTVDADGQFSPDIVADIRDWSWDGDVPDLIWASPPCDEFARELMPWTKTGKHPDMSIVNACIRIIQEASPKYWVIENVRGALRYFAPILGRPKAKIKAYYLWGHFPELGEINLGKYRTKGSIRGQDKIRRAMIPYPIVNRLAEVIEAQEALL